MAVILDPHDEAAVNGSPHNARRPESPQSTESRACPSEAFAHAEFWTHGAPKRLRKGLEEAHEAWSIWWGKRKPRATVARLVHSAGSPLAWGVNVESLTEECRALIEIANELDRGADAAKFAKKKTRLALEEAVARWLDAAHDGDTNVGFGLGCLAAADVLHRLGLALGPEQGWPLVDFLHSVAEDARPWAANVAKAAGTTLAQQLVAGELPLTLSYLFPEVAPFDAMRREAQNRLAEGIETLCGDNGMVRAGHLDALRPLIASWTRCHAIGAHVAKGTWRRDVHERFQAAVRQALRWTDAEGRPLLASDGLPAWTPDFLAAALRSSGRGSDAAAARLLVTGDAASEVPAIKCKAPRPSSFSESANLVLLRAAWPPTAPTLAIDYSGVGMRVAATVGGRSLFAGTWTASSRVDGNLLKPVGSWNAVCWFTDKDVDYIELALDLESGARLERQILLARSDGFLLLADHLQNPSAAALEHSWQLPLAENIKWQGEEETRDVVLAEKCDVGAPSSAGPPRVAPRTTHRRAHARRRRHAARPTHSWAGHGVPDVRRPQAAPHRKAVHVATAHGGRVASSAAARRRCRVPRPVRRQAVADLSIAGAAG